MNKRTWTDEQLIEACKTSFSKNVVMKKLGLKENNGGSNRSITDHIKRLNIDISHFTGQGWNKGTIGVSTTKKLPLEAICIENSTYNSYCSLKKRLLKEGLLKNCCARCEMDAIWKNEKLVLVMDHINGIHNDNRLENLRLLCPNCHSQTDTFAGRNTKLNRFEKKKLECLDCKNKITYKSKSGYCVKCVKKYQKEKILNSSREEDAHISQLAEEIV